MAIDLFCGLGGWTEGLLAEGYYVVGFDLERHRYPRFTSVSDSAGIKTPGNNSALKWSDRPIARLKDAKGELVVGEWDEYPAQLVIQDVLTLHGKQFKDAALIVASPPCQAYSYRAMPWKRAKALPPPDNSLFEACFRIQREAIEAAGHFIPLVVENVRGAQKWVGRARWNFGSFYLWGDVPALMPMVRRHVKMGRAPVSPNGVTRRLTNPGEWKEEDTGTKNSGGSWFNIGSPGQKVTNKNPVHEGVKNGKDWFGAGENCSAQRRAGSKSNARKAASAAIAKIPLALAQHIARVYRPTCFQ